MTAPERARFYQEQVSSVWLFPACPMQGRGIISGWWLGFGDFRFGFFENPGFRYVHVSKDLCVLWRISHFRY
jgi:hypothetical protein